MSTRFLSDQHRVAPLTCAPSLQNRWGLVQRLSRDAARISFEITKGGLVCQCLLQEREVLLMKGYLFKDKRKINRRANRANFIPAIGLMRNLLRGAGGCYLVSSGDEMARGR